MSGTHYSHLSCTTKSCACPPLSELDHLTLDRVGAIRGLANKWHGRNSQWHPKDVHVFVLYYIYTLQGAAAHINNASKNFQVI